MMEKYLTKLGTLLQKRKRASFKNDLRAQLLARAEELNAQPAKRAFEWPSFQTLFLGRLIPATAGVLIVLLAFQFLLPTTNLLPELVNVAEAKDYYTLTPATEDETGVASESSFTLSSKGDLSAEEVKSVLRVYPETEITVEQVSDTEVLVKPAADLEPGEVYNFTLDAQNLADSPFPKKFSWAYEVSDHFRVTGTIPGDKEAGVPMNSGIEVTFTYNGISAEDFEKAFSISPAVTGEFEVNGKTGIFIPKEDLEGGIIYTVTVSGDLGIDGQETMGTDYSFQFETSNDSAVYSRLNFTRSVYEFSPEDVPQMQFYYWGDESEDQSAQLEVYAYKDGEAYGQALQDYRSSAPTWSYFQERFYTFKTEGLEKVLSVEDYKSIENNGYFAALPDALSAGYYIVKLSENDFTDFAFLQVSSQAVYINLNADGALVWVNSTETGEPVKDASVQIMGTEFTASTNKDGVATIEEALDSDEFKEGEWYNLIIKVSSEETTTYYEAPFYKSVVGANESYWQFMHTDRLTYLPSDTINYWGFVQGREEPIEDKATVYLIEGYMWGFESVESMKSQHTVLDQHEIAVKDGETFEDAFETKKLAPGSYMLVLVQEGNQLSSTSFYVQDYTEPAYEMTVSADKTALYVGETAHISISTAFFDGTPVPNTELRITVPGEEEQLLKTDENGLIEFDWKAVSEECSDDYCYHYANPSIAVAPVQEELGPVEEWLSFKVMHADTVMDEANASFTNEAFDFQTYDVDLEQVNFDASAFATYFNYDSIFGDAGGSSKVDMTLTQVDYVKYESGEYYDVNDKVVRKKYDYEREEKVLSQETLEPNGKGEYHYSGDLSDEHDYDIALKIYDEDGNFYIERETIVNHVFSNPYSSLLNLVIPGAENMWADGSADIGEKVTVEVKENEDEPLSGFYLFMEEQKGIQNYSVSADPSYTFKFGKEDVPNVYITAVNFDGNYYRESNAKSIKLDTSDRVLELEVKADKENYEPGEEVTLSIKAGEQAEVNLYLVDEAYYALFAEQMRDPVSELYSSMNDGVYYTYISHRIIKSDSDGGKGGCFVAGTMILMADGSSKPIEQIEAGDKVLTRENEWSDTLVPVEVLNTVEHDVGEYLLVNGELGVTEEHVLFINGQWQVASELNVGDALINSDGDIVVVDSIEHVRAPVKVYNFETQDKHTYFADGIYVHNDKGEAREDFKDTAFFDTVKTDSAGNASVTFELPDNITSWRISATAVSGGEEIKAGTTSASIAVSKDVFVNPVINSVYLEGDEPSLPVRAYGVALDEDSKVKFSMGIEALGFEEEAEGTAFATTYFKLPALESGDFTVSTTAKADDKDDTVILPVSVIASHMTRSSISYDLLSEDTAIQASKDQRTEVHFLNNEVGIIYGTLLEAAYQDGGRADEAAARTVAIKWLNDLFEENHSVPEFPTETYQKTADSGGIALLPYADEDLELSSKMAALAPDEVSKSRLIAYFEAALNDKDHTLSEKILALYGLAALDQSYLSELNYFVDNFELSDEDKLYAGLAYSRYGEDDAATELFLEIYKAGDAEWTLLLATLAESIQSDLSEELWTLGNKLADKEDETYLLEEMLYAKARLESGANKVVTFSLNGEKFELDGREQLVRSFLPEDLKSLTVSKVKGEVAVVSFYQSPVDLDTIKTDGQLSISRSYQVNGKEVTSLKAGDIVEVHVHANAKEKGVYAITDYLPSGLQTATWASHADTYSNDSRYRHPYSQEGQVLRFSMVCNDGVCTGGDFYYLARVVNPGSFVLEPATIQSYQDPESINLSGERSTLTIE